MATTEDKKPVWGAPPTTGAWAAQVEEEEAANGGELEPMPTPVEAPKPFRAGGADRAGFSALAPEAFPSLGETANVKETKKDKKKKQQKMSLTSFMAASTARKEEVINLPTAPRARSDDDAPKAGLGGGFKNYGGDRGSSLSYRHSLPLTPTRLSATLQQLGWNQHAMYAKTLPCRFELSAVHGWRTHFGLQVE